MHFITNNEQTLIEFFRNAKGMEEINILVGYCYLSGFKTIMQDEEARDNFLKANIKILIGMHVDSVLKTEYFKYQKNESSTLKEMKEEVTENYIDYLNTESPEYINEAKNIFLKVQNKTLEIRKTKESNHAKLYVFIPKNFPSYSMSGGGLITGSSNLTMAGLQEQKEFNVFSSEHEHVKFAKDFFDELWKEENSVSILNVDTYEKIKERTGLMYMASPYKIFQKIIYEYFEYTNTTNLKYEPKFSGYDNYQYQIDAIKDAINIIKSYNGVLIADVVGLGKSVIAGASARNLKEMNIIDDIYIICPPNLKSSWSNYSSDFSLGAEIMSSGLLDKVEKELFKNNKKNKRHLIIIDEAHNFRNSKTESYSKIKNICFGNKVILLTATPMHNATSDIFSLIDLFDGRLSKETDIESLKSKISTEEKEIKNMYKSGIATEEDKEKLKEMSKKIVNLITPILIRRTRKDLEENKRYAKDLKVQKIELNKVKDPILCDYELGNMSLLYMNTFEKISPYEEKNKENVENKEQKKYEKINHFRGVRYRPLSYLKEDQKMRENTIKEIYGDDRDLGFALTSSINLSKIMRHLLIRRFESSIGAFRKTIDNLICKYENISNWIDKGLFPVYKKGEDLNVEEFLSYPLEDESGELDNEDVEYDFNKEKREEYEARGLYIIENIKNVLKDDFFEDFKNDLNILKEIQKDWKNIEEDKKFDELKECIKKLKKENEDRKIIIFSEFLDTVNYLYEKIEEDKDLKKLFKPIKFSSKEKNSKREHIIENFDASIEKVNQKNNYFLLITTDTLSEGINLHRAGIIINYDIPYNPTIVIQRVGRINRIGNKLFENLYIYNFIPRIDAQKEIKNWTISNFKLTVINAVLGNDTKILKKEDEIASLFSIKEEEISKDDLSWDTKYKNIYYDIKEDKKLEEEIKNIPTNLFTKRNSSFTGIIKVVRLKEEITALCLKDNTMIYNISEIFKLLEAREDEKYEEPSRKFGYLNNNMNKLKNFRNKNYSHDGIIYLKEYVKSLTNIEDKNYIQKVIKYAEEKCFAAYSLNSIVKLFKVKILKKLSTDKINAIKNIIPESLIYRIENSENTNKSEIQNLIVTEEFENLSDEINKYS